MKRSLISEELNECQGYQKQPKIDSSPASRRFLDDVLPAQPRRFQHKEFDAPRQIRLLKVRYNNSGQLCGSFSYQSLDKLKHVYMAISYCWGNNIDGDKLWFDGNSYLDLGAEAKNVLHYWATKQRSSYVWIDTVCINQDHNFEKSQQVQIMREIYEKARRVIIWLGHTEYKGWGAQAMAYVDYVSKLPYEESFTTSASGRSSRDAELRGKLVSWNSKRGGLNALARVVCEPYFSRTWIIQEVVSATSAYIICDDAIMKWDNFARAVNLSNEYKQFSLYQHKRVRPLPDHFNAHLDAVSYIEKLRQRKANDTPLYIQDLLIQGRYARASKDVDKIYALRGLATDLDPGELVVDYTTPMKELYIKTTHFLLFEKKAVRSLEIAGTSKHKGGDGLPSWVVDFRPDLNKGIMIDPGGTGAGGQRGTLKYLEGDCLRVRGRIISKIASTIGPSSEKSQSQRFILACNIKSWYQEGCREIAQSYNQANTSSGTSLTKEASETPLADEVLEFENSVHEPETHLRKEGLEFENLVHKLKAPKVVKAGLPPDTTYLDSLALFISDQDTPRRLFMSFSDHVGLAPTTAEVDDLVCVLHGFRFPFILRRNQESASGMDVETYTLIGETFVPGLMDGEGLKMGNTEDIILR